MVNLQGWIAVGEREDGPAAEAALLRAGRTGDRDALERLVALHHRTLLALCYSILGHAEDAEDAVQETFLRALRALPGFRGDATVRTWLCRIAVNVCRNWKRDRRRDPASPGAQPWDEERTSPSPPFSSPEALALRHLQIMEALSILRPSQRAVLLLKEREGWSMAEIAAALGWNEKRVGNELYRARRALVEWRRRAASEGEAG
jgi:RNA polymerase sigma-70 factor (ECF subfamily)